MRIRLAKPEPVTPSDAPDDSDEPDAIPRLPVQGGEMKEATLRNFTINFGPQHPATHKGPAGFPLLPEE
jgi:hypothetical protein